MVKELGVCEKCGWYEHGQYGASWCADAGSAVKALLAATPVDSSQLGWGTSSVAFKPDENTTLVFEIHYSGIPAAFRLRAVHFNFSLHHEDVVDLVETIAAWRKRVLKRESNDGTE